MMMAMIVMVTIAATEIMTITIILLYLTIFIMHLTIQEIERT